MAANDRASSSAPPRIAAPQAAHFGLLALALVAVSAAAPLIVLSGLKAQAIAVWASFGHGRGVRAARSARLAISAAIGRRDRLALAGAGLCYGLHFVWWPMGFELTSFESTVLLLAAQPLATALLAWVVLGEPVTRRMGRVDGAGLRRARGHGLARLPLRCVAPDR